MKINLFFLLLVAPISLLSQTNFIEESSVQYSYLNNKQSKIYDNLAQNLGNHTTIYFVTIGNIAIKEEEDPIIYIDLPSINLRDARFESNFIRYNAEDDFA